MNFEILYGAIDKTESYRKTLIFVCQSNRRNTVFLGNTVFLFEWL